MSDIDQHNHDLLHAIWDSLECLHDKVELLSARVDKLTQDEINALTAKLRTSREKLQAAVKKATPKDVGARTPPVSS